MNPVGRRNVRREGYPVADIRGPDTLSGSQAGGLPEISRGLRAQLRYPRNTSQTRHDPGRVAQSRDRATRFWHPCRGANVVSLPAGGVASLNPRLISGSPRGCARRSLDALLDFVESRLGSFSTPCAIVQIESHGLPEISRGSSEDTTGKPPKNLRPSPGNCERAARIMLIN